MTSEGTSLFLFNLQYYMQVTGKLHTQLDLLFLHVG